MKSRPFGADAVPVSEIGLGTWQLGGAEWGAVTDDAALATLRAALESGVSFIDTADIYGLGRSESLIGRFLKDTAATPFIATKLGRSPEPGWPENFELETMRRHVEASLERLGVEALDLVQTHCIPLDVMRRGEVFGHLETLRGEGKLRRYGASVESMEEALVCLEHDGLYSLQIIFNVFRQKPIHTLFAAARKRNVGLIARLPLASGLLAGKLTRESRFPEADHRNFNRDGQQFNVGETFAGLPFESGVELTEKVRALLPVGMGMAQLALRWCLDFEEIGVVIPGAKRAEQVVQNASASDLPALGEDLHAKLRDLYEAEVEGLVRGSY